MMVIHMDFIFLKNIELNFCTYFVREGTKMPGTRKMILKHVMSGICFKMNRTKQLPGDIMETPLNRCLTTLDITMLGIFS